MNYRSRKGMWVALGVALALGMTPAYAGQALSVRVAEPFEVDGRFFDSGTLTLREVAAYSPVATLTEICVEGDCLGVFLAETVEGSTVADSNQVVFGRAADGHLVLEALAFAGAQPFELYGFEREERGWRVAHAHSGPVGTLTAGR